MRKATPQEKRHMERIKEMDCVLCGASGVDVHHIRSGQGLSQRASNYLVIPLCKSCHQGKNGIHGDRSMLRIFKVEELDLLALTLEKLLKAA